MPGKTFSAPKAWKRPATRIYNDNYRFGNSLYSGAVADLDKRSDRPIATLLRTYSPPRNVSEDRGVRRAVLEADLGIANYSNSELHRSLSAQRMNELGLTANYKPLPPPETSSGAQITSTSSAHNAISSSSTTQRSVETFSTYASAKALANVEAELEESRARRRRQRAALIRPESAYYSSDLEPTMGLDSGLNDGTTGTGSSGPYWMERCRELRAEIDRLNNELVDSESRIKNESSSLKAKLSQDVTDLVLVLDEQDRVNAEMSKAIKKQHRQIEDLQASLVLNQERTGTALDNLVAIQRRCNQLATDIDAVRTVTSQQQHHQPHTFHHQQQRTSLSSANQVLMASTGNANSVALTAEPVSA